MKRNNYFRLIIPVLLLSTIASAQEPIDKIKSFLKNEVSLELSQNDIESVSLTDSHFSSNGEILYCYVQQYIETIPLVNTTSTFAIKDDNIYFTGNNLQNNLAEKVKGNHPEINVNSVLDVLAFELDYTTTSDNLEINELNSNQSYSLEYSKWSNKPILIDVEYFFKQNGEIVPVWRIRIEEKSHLHWWNFYLNANTLDLIQKDDYVISCDFGIPEQGCDHSHVTNEKTSFPLPAPPPGGDHYNVFAIPTESPSHGPRTIEVDPHDVVASPYAWHDVNGVEGEEYTITRGNNVYAYEDLNNSDNFGYAPDGGANLDFNFPLDFNTLPENNLDPAITNLFYMNNIMHDVWYHYGFDESSGNFQENNYGNGGAGSDGVYAEAQDGGGTNNANFSTPGDGSNPRMQMYLWDPAGPQNGLFLVNSPASIAGSKTIVEANFGPGIPTNPFSSDIVIYEDGVDESYDACEAPINAAQMNGKVVIMRRSSCNFIDQVFRAQNAGALAVIMTDNIPAAPIAMTGSGQTITIPAFMVNQYNGELIISEILLGNTVNCTIGNTGPYENDGDFDNGIIAHEYGHGISTRLTGGANNSACLWNEDQMGEGWSDWFGLMLTIEPGDQPEDIRGIGTFASGESTTGTGIRPAPYSTDFSINGHTYSSTNNPNITQPHGIGFVWATMLWDLNWAFIDEYGYDSDVYHGTGGNNIVMHLVINGLKLQACSPGFIDGRDAILEADLLLYGGIHECLIWKVFAKRGLGYSAEQGNTDDRLDQVQAFDLPPGMDHTSYVEVCDNYYWEATGTTYTESGTYTRSIPSDGIGCDTVETLELTIIDPSTFDTSVDYFNDVTLRSNETSLDYQWVDCNDNYAIIDGEINQFFFATENGEYAVIISSPAGCSDTSDCYLIDKVGLEESTFESELSLYPNPTTGEIMISFKNEKSRVRTTLYDLIGKSLSSKEFISVDKIELEIKQPAGIYLIQIEDEDGRKALLRVEKM